MRYETPRDGGYYHQNERDRAVALGCAGIIGVALMIAMAVVCAVAWSFAP